MELEWHQLDLRYGDLRVRKPAREKKLIASIAEVGQLVPIATVQSEQNASSRIVIDGFKRIHALKRLRQDTVAATDWELTELQALLLHRSLRSSDGETSLEQAWLLDEIHRRFDLTVCDLARQFERSPSWVSRRLALVRELPQSVQQAIRTGDIVPHAAAKYLVPLARANAAQCERLARATAKHHLSSRQFGELYAGWRDGDETVRERLVENPLLYLRAREGLSQAGDDPADHSAEALVRDITTLAAVARRARTILRECGNARLSDLDFESLFSGLRLAQTEIERLRQSLSQQQQGGDDDA